jgi:hypothetical protein
MIHLIGDAPETDGEGALGTHVSGQGDDGDFADGAEFRRRESRIVGRVRNVRQYKTNHIYIPD